MTQQNTRPVAYEGDEAYVFVSYAHADAPQVFPILRRLQSEGFRIWFDDGIDPGSEWPESIAAHLDASAACLAFISSRSLGSKNCRREINYALAKDKPFLYVMLEKVQMTPGMDMQLSSYQSILYYRYPDPENDVADRLAKVDILQACRNAAYNDSLGDNDVGDDSKSEPQHVESVSTGPHSEPTPDEVVGSAPSARGEAEVNFVLGTDATNQTTSVSGAKKKGGGPGQDDTSHATVEPTSTTPTETQPTSGEGSSHELRKVPEPTLVETRRERKRDSGGATGRGSALKSGPLRWVILAAVVAAVAIGVVIYVQSRPVTFSDGTSVEVDAGSVTLKDLALTQADVDDLLSLQDCRSYTFTNCTLPQGFLSHLSAKADISRLEFRNCTFTGGVDLSPLSNLSKLYSLYFVGCGLDDSSFGTYTGGGYLTDLDLSGNQLTRVPDLNDDVELGRLNISSNSVTDLSALASQGESLSELYANSNQIQDVSVLRSLIYLKKLRLHNNPLTGLTSDALQNLTVLELLDLGSDDSLASLDASAAVSCVERNAATLEQLNLDGWDLSAAALPSMPALTALSLKGCSVSTVPDLNDASGLEYLDLSNNQLASLTTSEGRSGIASCSALRTVLLSHNQLTSMDGWPVASDTDQDVTLTLDHNQLTSLQGLVHATEHSYDPCWSFRQLAVYGNRGIDLSAIASLKGSYCLLDVTSQADIDALVGNGEVDGGFTSYYVTSIPDDLRVTFESAMKGIAYYTYCTEDEAAAKVTYSRPEVAA